MTALIDGFGRTVSYLRLSVTDRCNFRCVYCMPMQMHFAPRHDVLRYEEIVTIARVFATLGVRKLRVTGGEPLVRRDIVKLLAQLAVLPGINELAVTTNGAQLPALAVPLRAVGVHTLNISIDSLRADRFRQLTRIGRLDDVINGIDAACRTGFGRIRLNAVILRGINDDEIVDLVTFAIERGVDIAFIEEMPLGEYNEYNREAAHMPSAAIRAVIEQAIPLQAVSTGGSDAGPARYYRVIDSATRVGFISPHSHNFCGDCNRVRLTATGRLLLCLGNEHSVDLRAIVRSGVNDMDAALTEAITMAMRRKPARHHFSLGDIPTISRTMNVTGG